MESVYLESSSSLITFYRKIEEFRGGKVMRLLINKEEYPSDI